MKQMLANGVAELRSANSLPVPHSANQSPLAPACRGAGPGAGAGGGKSDTEEESVVEAEGERAQAQAQESLWAPAEGLSTPK